MPCVNNKYIICVWNLNQVTHYNTLLMLHYLLNFNWILYFKKLIVRLYALFVFNINTKFGVHQIVFINKSIKSCFIHNFKVKEV